MVAGSLKMCPRVTAIPRPISVMKREWAAFSVISPQEGTSVLGGLTNPHAYTDSLQPRIYKIRQQFFLAYHDQIILHFQVFPTLLFVKNQD